MLGRSILPRSFLYLIQFCRLGSREEAEEVIDRVSRITILDDSQSPLKIRFADSEAQKSFKSRRQQIPSPLQQSSRSYSPQSSFSDATMTPTTSRSDSFPKINPNSNPNPMYSPAYPPPPPVAFYDSPLPLAHVLRPLYPPSSIPIRASSAFALHPPAPQISLLPPLPAVTPAYLPLPPLRRPSPIPSSVVRRFDSHHQVDFPTVRPRDSRGHSRSVGAAQGDDLLSHEGAVGGGGKDDRRSTVM